MAENYTPLIQRLLTALDNPLYNNSYIWSISPDIPEDFKGNVLQYLIDQEGGLENFGNDWQSIASSVGVTEPVNGSWLQAIVEALEA
jgi:hypothetical protein